MAQLPTIDEIRKAADLIYSLMQPTPQICWPLVSERLGTEVWLKHENHTPTGSFKARTAVVYAAELMKRAPQTKGLITATRGNHGQSVALAAKRFGLKATIIVPKGNSQEKNAAMRAQGGELIEHGEDFQESREYAEKLSRENGFHLVPNYHQDIVRGVATYWLELFSKVTDLDVVYVPIGQGSGICSCVAVRNGLGLRTRIVGVVAEKAPAYALSFEARKCVDAAATTKLADGMACRKPDEESLQIILESVDHVVRVSEDEVARAMKMIFVDTHNVAEGAGAAALAAALKEKAALAGRRVAAVVSGGNVDYPVFGRVLMETNIESEAATITA
jgi:threonine dehydratase